MSQFWEDDIVGTKPAIAFGLFAPRTTSTSAMLGAGQQSRDEARERATRGSADAYRRILDALATGGMTRKELAEATGLLRDTVNGRVSELRDQARVYTEGRRGGESIVHRREAA